MLLPAIRSLAPGVVDLHLPAFGTPGQWAFVSLAKTHPHQARQVASALWGSAALRSTRYLILVDAELDVRDVRAVLCEVGAHAVPERDMFSYDGPAGGSADGDATPLLARHVGIDATTKIAGEHSGPARQRLASSPEIAALVSARWAEYGLDLELAPSI